MHRRRGIDSLLAALVRGEAATDALAAVLASEERRSQLLRAAEDHRVVGHLYGALAGVADVPADVWAHVVSDVRGQVARHLRSLADLRFFGDVMAAADLPWLVVKGPVVAEQLYAQPELRTYGDLDLIVPAAAFGDAVRALEREGAEVIDRNWRLLVREGRAQLHLVLAFGTLADLHWHVLNQRWLRRSFTISMDDLFSRRQLVDAGGVWTPTLDGVDTLLHLCVHAALSGGNRLSWLSDITRAITAELVWPQVVERAEQWSARSAVYVMLRRAQQTLGAPVPDEVLHVLGPRHVCRTSAAVDRLGPLDARPRSLQAVWAETARDSAWAQAAAGLRRAGRPVLWRARAAVEGTSLKGTERIDVLEESGGDAERAHYLAEAEGRGTADGFDHAPLLPKRASST